MPYYVDMHGDIHEGKRPSPHHAIKVSPSKPYRHGHLPRERDAHDTSQHWLWQITSEGKLLHEHQLQYAAMQDVSSSSDYAFILAKKRKAPEHGNQPTGRRPFGRPPDTP